MTLAQLGTCAACGAKDVPVFRTVEHVGGQGEIAYWWCTDRASCLDRQWTTPIAA